MGSFVVSARLVMGPMLLLTHVWGSLLVVACGWLGCWDCCLVLSLACPSTNSEKWACALTTLPPVRSGRWALNSHVSETMVSKESAPLMWFQLQRCLVLVPSAYEDSCNGEKPLEVVINTCCAWAGGTFFQLCCCVSFWLWWEIGFGFTYLRTLLNNFFMN